MKKTKNKKEGERGTSEGLYLEVELLVKAVEVIDAFVVVIVSYSAVVDFDVLKFRHFLIFSFLLFFGDGIELITLMTFQRSQNYKKFLEFHRLFCRTLGSLLPG